MKTKKVIFKKKLKMEKPKKLILDYSKWRCGEGGKHSVGKGSTQLLNDEGFMCCIGQWSQQCGATDSDLLHKGEPNELKAYIPLFTHRTRGAGGENSSNDLSIDCIDINDRKGTTPEEKIEALRVRLHQEGIELEVINKPQ
jgi:hypothetical protein